MAASRDAGKTVFIHWEQGPEAVTDTTIDVVGR
jgi:hypothetical protein